MCKLVVRRRDNNLWMFANIHPELCDLLLIYGRRISNYRDLPDWQEQENNRGPVYAGALKQGVVSWSLSGIASAQNFAILTEEEIQRGRSYFVSLPSVFIAAHVDYMRTVRILPLGHEQTEIEVEWLFLPQTLERESFDLTDITDFGILVMQQDAIVSELNHKGMHSIKFDQGVLMPEEHYVKGLQDWVRDCVGR